MKKKKAWYEYLWILTPVYLTLGAFNILFGWLGMIAFILPMIIAIFGGNKAYCNRYCARGQLFEMIGGHFNLSRKKNPPKFLYSWWFRYGFLTFFMTMFILMIINTVHVFSGTQNLKQVVTLLWTFKVPWKFAYHGTFLSLGVAQFAFGFYSMMLTSTILGLVTMLLFKPRSWCVYCPMGTMTQGICKLKNVGKKDER
ncbi:4Fe-4S binding domain-containing protein [Hathewaya proteolytica DSM 3090]|uniref:4Fe-4S binding domain-containing protein n=1 Tax=Hathewaya proteolytica DSM 3090 TaxID=1121331 RepID=A0A1M6K4K6_9CLOT|nr:4Fe-4S binding protein [Hathewaya proteolytica]SHJ53903.1 4Fe-4S binding domain-containing protein [Hathewaya proteolytica DSM 3090]